MELCLIEPAAGERGDESLGFNPRSAVHGDRLFPPVNICIFLLQKSIKVF